MTVGHMVNHLAHGPTTFAVGCVELSVTEAVDGSAETLGQQAKRLDVGHANAGQAGRRSVKTADGIAEVVQICHGPNSITLKPVEAAEIGPGPGARAALGHGTVLGLLVMVMLLVAMVMMVFRCGERRAGKHQEQ